jgi:hypothetical protein
MTEEWGEGTLEQRRRAYRQAMGEDVADMLHAHLNKLIDNMMLANAGVAHSVASRGPKQ